MKIALITGVSRKEGLGFETAKQLGQNGYKVILSSKKLSEAEPLARALIADKIESDAVEIDVTSDDSVNAAVQIVQTKYGKIDLLINNAVYDILNTSSVLEKDLNELSKEFETNFIGVWRVSKSFAPLLIKSGHGRIVNITSSKGSFTDTEWGLLNFDMGLIPAYSFTKSAVNGLTIKMAKEFKEYKILVNAVCPGFTATYPGLEDMGARPVSEAVEGIIWAATLKDDGPSGHVFRDKKMVSW